MMLHNNTPHPVIVTIGGRVVATLLPGQYYDTRTGWVYDAP